MLNDSEHQDNRTVTVSVTGRLGHHSWDQFRPLLQRILLQEVTDIQIDCKELTGLDSAGMSFLGMLKHSLTAKGGVLTMTHVPRQLQVELSDFQ